MNIFKVDVDILVVKVNNVIYLAVVHVSHGVRENTLQSLSQSTNKPVNRFHNKSQSNYSQTCLKQVSE